MKKTLTVAVLTMAAFATGAPMASAKTFGLFTCGLRCRCCSKCCFCVRPYNAFSPVCSGCICCEGCNPLCSGSCGFGGCGPVGPCGYGLQYDGVGMDGCGPHGCCAAAPYPGTPSVAAVSQPVLHQPAVLPAGYYPRYPVYQAQAPYMGGYPMRAVPYYTGQ
jgi:hypothetical protein